MKFYWCFLFIGLILILILYFIANWAAEQTCESNWQRFLPQPLSAILAVLAIFCLGIFFYYNNWRKRFQDAV